MIDCDLFACRTLSIIICRNKSKQRTKFAQCHMCLLRLRKTKPRSPAQTSMINRLQSYQQKKRSLAVIK